MYGGSGQTQDVRGHEGIGRELTVVLQPGIIAQLTHLYPLVRVHSQQLCSSSIHTHAKQHNSTDMYVPKNEMSEYATASFTDTQNTTEHYRG